MAEALREADKIVYSTCVRCDKRTSPLSEHINHPCEGCHIGQSIIRTKLALTAHASGEYTEVVTGHLFWLMLHIGCLLKWLPACPETARVRDRCTLTDAETGCSADAMFRCLTAYLQAKDGGEDEQDMDL